MSSLRLALAVARRELTIYLRSPIALTVAAAFLVLEGASFAALVGVLADPARPAPMGAVLETHFGGTLVHWMLELTVLAALAARLAEERRTGTWEALVTAPVSETAAIVGAWLAAVALWALLWLLCLSHVAILVALAPPGASIDAGPVVTAYAGEVLVGATGLALAMAAGAWSSQPLVATIAGFAALCVWLLLGELAELAPSAIESAPSLASALERLGPRRALTALARGEVRWDAVVTLVALAIAGLRLTTALVGVGRRRGGTIAAIAIESVLVGAALALAAVLVGRAVSPWDVTAARRNSLESATTDVLARMHERVDAIILRPNVDANRPLFEETERVLARMTAAQPALAVRTFDPASDPSAVSALAAFAAVDETELVRGGAVILTRGPRARAIALRDLEGTGAVDLEARTFEHVRIEAALGQALAELLDDAPVRLCATTGHGELTPDDWSPVTTRLAADGLAVDMVDLAGGVPSRCRVVIVVGPSTPLSVVEADAVAKFLDGVGRLFLALPAHESGARMPLDVIPKTGLEAVLATWNIATPANIVGDPALAFDMGTLRVVDGYGDHPAVRGFAGRRPTVWFHPRAIVAPDAVALVYTTDHATVRDALGNDPGKASGVMPLAVAAEHGDARVVVSASASAMAFREVQRGWGGDVLAARAIGWLAGRVVAPIAPEKSGDRVKLVMSANARRAVAALAIGGVPIVATALLWLVGRRRRRKVAS
jgi:ABC-type transport system involved in multi-copper enzyme maturation permease subunit